jgi:phospholipase A1
VADFGENPGTGKGYARLDATYALSDLIGLDLYLMGQMFTGYGESLLIYNRKDTRVIFGFSIIR